MSWNWVRLSAAGGSVSCNGRSAGEWPVLEDKRYLQIDLIEIGRGGKKNLCVVGG